MRRTDELNVLLTNEKNKTAKLEEQIVELKEAKEKMKQQLNTYVEKTSTAELNGQSQNSSSNMVLELEKKHASAIERFKVALETAKPPHNQ